MRFLVELEGPGTAPPSVLYHVTMLRWLPSILKQGLQPRHSGKTVKNYAYNSKGKVFLTVEGGVEFWKEKIEAHEFDQFDDPQGLAVLTINAQGLSVSRDQQGSMDARHDAYYTTQPIEPIRITHVEKFPEAEW